MYTHIRRGYIIYLYYVSILIWSYNSENTITLTIRAKFEKRLMKHYTVVYIYIYIYIL